VLDTCPDVIDSIPKLMRDEKNIEDAQKEGNELFLDVCESFRYGVMSYASEQAVPREVLVQREIMSINLADVPGDLFAIHKFFRCGVP